MLSLGNEDEGKQDKNYDNYNQNNSSTCNENHHRQSNVVTGGAFLSLGQIITEDGQSSDQPKN